MAKTEYPTRGQSKIFSDFRSPLAAPPLKRDVVPPVSNPSFTSKDPLKLFPQTGRSPKGSRK